jgi:serine/threonine protein kinase
VKPENFLLGVGERRSKHLYMIDFGLAKRYQDAYTKEHIPYKDSQFLSGTIRYASLYCHEGIESSRRDDFESLGYIFVYLLKGGNLPWMELSPEDKMDKHKKIMAIHKIKKETTCEKLCEGLPTAVLSYFKYVRSLEFL